MKKLSIRNGEMIKGGWVAPYNVKGHPDVLTDEVFSAVKESGINLLYPLNGCYSEDDKEKLLQLCDRHDIYIMIADSAIAKEDFDLDAYLPTLESYKKRKCIYGIHIIDEPGKLLFPIISKNIEKVKPYVGELVLYINQLPIYATDRQLYFGAWTDDTSPVPPISYEAVIEDFYSNVDVPLLSYDLYPFTSEKGNIKPKYYKQLMLMKNIAKKHELSYWNFTQVTSFKRDKIRNMTYSEMAWLNNTSIACGVSGIQYFCYYTPESGREAFATAMVDHDGKVSRHYHYAKKLNSELSMIEKYILEYEHMGTMTTGNTLGEFPQEYALKSFGNLDKLSCDGAILGCFEKDGKYAYFAVNTSVNEARVITLKFKNNISFKAINGSCEESLTSDKYTAVLHEGGTVMIVEE